MGSVITCSLCLDPNAEMRRLTKASRFEFRWSAWTPSYIDGLCLHGGVCSASYLQTRKPSRKQERRWKEPFQSLRQRRGPSQIPPCDDAISRDRAAGQIARSFLLLSS